tara:strand:+ start:411 stop:797 length:387 start_codon:yes stop_codon:yes gene_type:complete
MTPEQEQLHKANEIIKELKKTYHSFAKPAINDYFDEYLKPKDELFELFLEYQIALGETYIPGKKGTLYTTFLKSFGSRLNGTAGLDELRNSIMSNLPLSLGKNEIVHEVTTRIDNIKSRLQGENQGEG